MAMDTLLPGLWSLSPLGGMIGVIVLFYLLLANGKIITRTSHERELALTKTRGDEWRDTALDTRLVNAELLKQNGQLIEGAKVSEHFYRAMNPENVGDTLVPPVRGT